jgi:hypothetical protein
MSQLLLYVFLSAFTLGFLVWLFMFEYRSYRVTVLRHHLFEARDNLFAAASRGNLSFNDRAYGMVRSVINGLILKAEAVSIPYILLLFLMCSRKDREARSEEFEERLAKAIQKLSEPGKAAIAKALQEINICVVSHIMHISLVFCLPTQLMKLSIHANAVLDHVDYHKMADEKIEHVGVKVHSQLVMLEREAYAIGEYTDLDCRLQAAA